MKNTNPKPANTGDINIGNAKHSAEPKKEEQHEQQSFEEKFGPKEAPVSSKFADNNSISSSTVDNNKDSTQSNSKKEDRTRKIIIAVVAIVVSTAIGYFVLRQTGVIKTTIVAPIASGELMHKMKTKGCVFDGMLTGFGGNMNNKIAMLKRTNCEFIHRSIQTWNQPANFNQIEKDIARIKKETGKDFIYSFFLAESIRTDSVYYYPDEKRNFNFNAMCTPGTYGSWGEGTCKPALYKPEYRKYVRYTTRRAIDMGIQDIVFGQVYYQDPNWKENPVIPEVVSEIRNYALSVGKDVAIGAQTNTMDDEKYLRNFDYITGGVGQDLEGNIEDGPCWSYYWDKRKTNKYCWAMMWHDDYKSKANNILIYLDWNNSPSDDMNRFTRMSRDKRASFMKKAYDFFTNQEMGFLLPLGAILDGSGRTCYGSAPNFYSANLVYSCKDENGINAVLAGAIPLKGEAEFVSQVVPDIMYASQDHYVSVTMKNTSKATWTKTDQIKLGAQGPTDNMIWGINRVELNDIERIAPGEEKEFIFKVTAPAKPGEYTFQWQMVNESKEWFGDFSNEKIVKVETVE